MMPKHLSHRWPHARQIADYTQENVCRLIMVYAIFSTYAYLVNLLLASRFMQISKQLSAFLSYAAVTIYIGACTVNWCVQEKWGVHTCSGREEIVCPALVVVEILKIWRAIWRAISIKIRSPGGCVVIYSPLLPPPLTCNYWYLDFTNERQQSGEHEFAAFVFIEKSIVSTIFAVNAERFHRRDLHASLLSCIYAEITSLYRH